ncbi:hypothetical protein JKP88DRAFT_261829 [Tribonema minus]|uniref:Uncharacterized protein n=1 Tax=Tribonema minus TaxID=303371 RepID=A0A836CQI5_9STRA|nr:hypothetical protein JKP88DRAFT_261829 [Tribonema minus]
MHRHRRKVPSGIPSNTLVVTTFDTVCIKANQQPEITGLCAPFRAPRINTQAKSDRTYPTPSTMVAASRSASRAAKRTAAGLSLLLATASGHFSTCPGAQSIKITNLSSGQNLTEPVMVIHGKHADPIWELDGEPTDALKAYATTGDATAITDLLATEPLQSYVCGSLVGDVPLGPGESAFYDIDIVETANCTCDQIAATILSKVAWTNDGFVGVSSTVLSVAPWNTLKEDHAPWDEYLEPALDAGAEANTERCADIDNGCPATVTPGSNVPSIAANRVGEGIIFTHRGIGGAADLDAATFDFANPIALIQLHNSVLKVYFTVQPGAADLSAATFDFANPIALIQLHNRLPDGVSEDDLPITETQAQFFGTGAAPAAAARGAVGVAAAAALAAMALLR